MGVGVIRGDLYKVEGELVDNYNRALEKAVGVKTGLTSFFVDKRGESREICDELGEHYLQSGPAHRYCIIVSPDQRNAGLVHEEFSFDNEIIDFLYENYLPSISVATRVDALYGEIEDGVGHYETLEDLLLIRKIHLEIQTPSTFMTKARTLQGYIMRLRRNPDLLIKNDSIVPKRILELVNEVGDVRNYNLNPIQATLEMGTFYTRLFDGVVVFRDIRDEDVIDMKRPDENRRQSKRKRKDNPTTIVIYDTKDYKPEDGPAVKFIHMQATEDVLDFLIDSEYATYSDDLIDSRITRLEEERLVDGGYDVTAISREEKTKALHDYSVDMPEEWSALRALKRKIGIGYKFDEVIDSYPATVRAMLLEPVRGDGGDEYLAVEHLLTKLFPRDYEKMYFHNMEDLMKIFQSGNERKRKYIGHVLSDSK